VDGGGFEMFSMKRNQLTRRQFSTLLVSAPLVGALAAQASDQTLQATLNRAVAETLTAFAGRNLAADQLAVTVVDLRAPNQPVFASHRGDVQIYPASVVKLFYMAAVHQWLEEGRLDDTAELRRAMRDMIVVSGNEPTHYLVDLLTGTTSGPELPPDALEEWMHKRNTVNRHFAALGYTKINVNRKPWCEGPYGRESQSMKVHAPNHRNWLTTQATARLMMEIAGGKQVTDARSAEMMKLLERDPFDEKQSATGQARGYTGIALPPGSKLWSKAGWTSQTRHDAACVELPDGTKFVLVTFTEGHANERMIIPTVARHLIRAFAETGRE
jgi:beta-lactamase class A